MKRFIAATLMAVLTLSLASSVFAQGRATDPHRAIKELQWTSHTGTNGIFNGFAVDSAIP